MRNAFWNDLVLGAVAAVLVAFAGAVHADPTWIGATGNWSDAANWQGGVLPGVGDTVRISNTVANITINLDAPTVTVKAIHFEGHTAPGDVTVTGGALELSCSDCSLTASTASEGGESNMKHYETSQTAIIAYPYGADFRVPVTFTSSSKVGIIGTGRDLHFRKAVSAPKATSVQCHNGIYRDPFEYVTKNLNDNDLSAYNKTNAVKAVNQLNTYVFFHDAFSAPQANIAPMQAPTGGMYFYGPSLDVNAMDCGFWNNAVVRIMSTNTVIRSGTVALMFGTQMQSEIASGYPTNLVIHFKNNASKNVTSANFHLGFVDRTIDRLTSEALGTTDATATYGYRIRSYSYANQGDATFIGPAPTTLTLRGTADAATEGMIDDEVSVVWDPVGAFTQTFSNRIHRTTGDLVVRGGTMKLNGAGSFAAARALVIESGATFELDSSLADALPRDLIVTSTSHLKLNGATVHVKRLVVDGVAQTDGTYTDTDWLSGEGSVVVTAGDCRSWIGGSGNWSDTTHWLNGKVPSSSSDIAVLDAQTDEDIAITMNADVAAANFPGVFEVVNRGSGTTVVRVAASLASNNGFVRVGRHARLEVSEGGAFFYETTGTRTAQSASGTVWPKRTRIAVVDGGEWRTCGGSTLVTNFCGRCWVNGEGSKLTISDGLHMHSGWNSDYPICVGAGAKVELTGGTFYQPHEGYNNGSDFTLFGGTADFGGGTYNAKAKCVGPGSAGEKHASGSDFGFGTVDLHGTVVARFGDPLQFRGLYAGTHLDWIVRDNVTMDDQGYRIGGRYETAATLDVYDRPGWLYTAQRGCGNFFLGSVYNSSSTAGDGTLHLWPGSYLQVGVQGLWAAGGDTNVKRETFKYQRGRVRVDAGAGMTVRGSTHTGYGAAVAPNGIRVGLGSQATNVTDLIYEGRFETAGAVTNEINLVIGGWFGTGTFVQDGGETRTATSTSWSDCGVTAVGMGGGEGALLVSNGVFDVRQSLWVGGCLTNDFIVSGNNTSSTGELYPNQFVEKGGYPIDNHGAEGLLRVSGGDLTVAKDLYVGADGTGVVSVVGSTGSFRVGRDMVLSNKTASVVRFAADASGVAPIEVGGRLVLSDAAALEVDLTACPDARRVKLFATTNAVEGAFASVRITPLDQHNLVWRNNGLWLIKPSGMSIFFK